MEEVDLGSLEGKFHGGGMQLEEEKSWRRTHRDSERVHVIGEKQEFHRGIVIFKLYI